MKVAKGGGLCGGVVGGVAYGVTAKDFVVGDGAGVDVRLDFVNGGDEASLRVVLEVAREPAVPHRNGGNGGARRRPGGAHKSGVSDVDGGGALDKLSSAAYSRPFGGAK